MRTSPHRWVCLGTKQLLASVAAAAGVEEVAAAAAAAATQVWQCLPAISRLLRCCQSRQQFVLVQAPPSLPRV